MKMTVAPSSTRRWSVVEQFVDLVGHQHGGRLVEDQDVGAAVENLDDLHPLAFTDTELGYDHLSTSIGADLLHDLGDAAASGGEIDAATAPAGLGTEDDVLEHGEVVGQLEVLMDHADTGADRVGWCPEGDLGTVDRDRALLGLVHAVEHLHEGRLTRPVLANDRVDGASPDREVDVVVGENAWEAFLDVGQFDRNVPARVRHVDRLPLVVKAGPCVGPERSGPTQG